ncbi:MAG: cytochrome b/b6 domain-containing protein [Galactobacter sp.]
MTTSTRFTLLGPADLLPRLVDAFASAGPTRAVGPDEAVLRKCLALGAAEAALVPPSTSVQRELLGDDVVVVCSADDVPAGYAVAGTVVPNDLVSASAAAAASGEATALIFDGELPEPRNPGLKDIMAAKKVAIATLGDVEAEVEEVEDSRAAEAATGPNEATEPDEGAAPSGIQTATAPPERVTAEAERVEPVESAPPRGPERSARAPRSAASTLAGWTVAAVIVVAIAVAAASLLMTLQPVEDFVHRYPGAAPQPTETPVGLPGWLGWQHFLNAFFMLLIIATGLRIRRETRPPATWTSRKTGRKVSLTVWLHQAIDLLWLVNGVVFLVLIFTTGHWQRLVPTDWDVIPNALSAGLQYLSLDWPTENGWVAYNGLQQITYFTTVFIAAPLAAVSGWRMSTVWPRVLDRILPMQLARRVHFPVMIYFVGFVVVHVGLVLSTGMKRNLNHVFAATDAGGWAGFVTFVVALVVMAAGWFLARPAFVAPVARVFGEVSSR